MNSLKGITAVAALALATAAAADTAKPASGEASQDAAIEQLRKDVRADANTLITAAMRFSADDATRFWPLYKNFEAQRKAIGDDKLALIKDYAAAYNTGSVTDAQAKGLMDRAVALEEKSLAAKRAFLQELAKALPAKTVARYYMVQTRIDLLTSLQLAAGVPLME